MRKMLLIALNWSEIWALLIPLAMLLFHRKQPASLKPVITYIWLALLINIIEDSIMGYNIHYPDSTLSNTPYYSVHSIARFTCFSIYFIKLPQASFAAFKKLLVVLSVAFLFFNFGFVENFSNPDHISGNLLTAEAYLLLIYCMQYYLVELREDRDNISDGPDFWIVTGLSIYVVINFFVFLFYVPLLNVDPMLADRIWDIHNIAFIIFCIFITKAFYGPFRNNYTN